MQTIETVAVRRAKLIEKDRNIMFPRVRARGSQDSIWSGRNWFQSVFVVQKPSQSSTRRQAGEAEQRVL